MSSLGPLHWIIVLIVMAILLVPAAVILKRTGHSPAWAILSLFPGISLIALWIFAFARWPALDAEEEEA